MKHPLPASGDAARLLQEYLDHAIPLVPQMQVSVDALSDTALVLSAPLAPNRNHIGTVFGGSLNGLATLSCWGLVWLLLHGRNAHIVIHESHMKFSRPATGTFSAGCTIPGENILDDFVRQYEQRGRARLGLAAEVLCENATVATFEGSFAAIDPTRKSARA